MNSQECEFLIVGSGAGGATLARELSKNGREVLLLERGKPAEKVGSARDTLRFYDLDRLTKLPAQSKEGVILWRTFMAGGSTMVSCANATRCLETELGALGISLEKEFAEAEREMAVSPIAPGLLSEGSEALMTAATKLGYQMELMPKMIDPERCSKCGQCSSGCAYHAKWTALEYLEEAVQNGTRVRYDTRVERVLIDGGRAKGVRAAGGNGRANYRAEMVILAAGGLGTPVILQQSGVEGVGENLFADLFVNTYGLTQGLNLLHEPKMTLVNHEFRESEGFILSPFVLHPRISRFAEMGTKGASLPAARMIGIMTKIVDEPVGRVARKGRITKPVTDRDGKRLQAGSSIAANILVKAGADRQSILNTRPQGAHPGGTAAIGRVVDQNLQTGVENLFVCDASVLPTSPGLPPILTICALAKRLGKQLVA